VTSFDQEMEQEGVLYCNRRCRHHTSIPLGGSQLSHIAWTFCMPLGHLFYLVTSPKQKGNTMMSRKELGSSNQFFLCPIPVTLIYRVHHLHLLETNLYFVDVPVHSGLQTKESSRL
jgi:hypothetical protein